MAQSCIFCSYHAVSWAWIAMQHLPVSVASRVRRHTSTVNFTTCRTWTTVQICSISSSLSSDKEYWSFRSKTVLRTAFQMTAFRISTAQNKHFKANYANKGSSEMPEFSLRKFLNFGTRRKNGIPWIPKSEFPELQSLLGVFALTETRNYPFAIFAQICQSTWCYIQ